MALEGWAVICIAVSNPWAEYAPLPCLSSSPTDLAFVKQERGIFYDVGEHALPRWVRVAKGIEPRSGLWIDPHVDCDMAVTGHPWRALKGPGLWTLCRYGRRYSRDSGTGWEARPVADLA